MKPSPYFVRVYTDSGDTLTHVDALDPLDALSLVAVFRRQGKYVALFARDNIALTLDTWDWTERELPDA